MQRPSRYFISYGRGRIRHWQCGSSRRHFTAIAPVLQNSPSQLTIQSLVATPVDYARSILDIPLDVTPHPLRTMDSQTLKHLTKRELRHLHSIEFGSMEEKADACFIVSTTMRELLHSDVKQASHIYHLLTDEEMKHVVFRHVIDTVQSDDAAKVYMQFIAQPKSHETRSNFTKTLLKLLKSDVAPNQKSRTLFGFFERIAQTEMVNSVPIFLDVNIFRNLLDIVGESNHSDLYSYFLHLNIRPKSKSVFKKFRGSLLTTSPRSQFIANTGYIDPKWYDLNHTKFNPIHASRIIEFYSFPELNAIHNHYVNQNDPARASLFLSFMVSKLEKEGKNELTQKPESYTKDRVLVILNCVLNLIIKFKSVSSATQILKFMKNEHFNVKLDSLVLLLKVLRRAKEYDQFITILAGIQLDTLKRNERNTIVDEIMLLMRDKFHSSPKVIIGYVSALFGAPQRQGSGLYILNELGILSFPYESTIAAKITSTGVVQAATVDNALTNSKLTSRALSYVYQVLFNSMDVTQRHDPTVINKYFQLYVNYMADNSVDEPDDKPLGVFLKYSLYVDENAEQKSLVPSGNYYLARTIFEYYKTMHFKGNQISSTTLRKLSNTAITKFNDFAFATEVMRFAKENGKMLSFYEIFPFIKKADENRDTKRFDFWMNELTKMGVKATSRELNEFIKFCREPGPAKDAYKYKWSITKRRRDNRKALDRLGEDFLPTTVGNSTVKLSLDKVTEEIVQHGS